MTTTGSDPQGTGERSREAGEGAREEMRGEAERMSGKAHGLKDEAKERAAHLLDEARDRTRSALDERKQSLARDVGDFAHALRASAGDLQDHDKAYVARYVEQAAGGVERIADTLNRQDLTDLVHQTEDFARRQPGLFIGGAVAAGFALARFLKSSSDARTAEGRDRETRQGSYGAAPSASTASYAATPADRPSGMEDTAHGNV